MNMDRCLTRVSGCGAEESVPEKKARHQVVINNKRLKKMDDPR
jgi:hypothetical protein